MSVMKMYQYAVRKVDDPLEAETWMNERADEGYRLEKIVLKRGLDSESTEIWIFMENEEEVEEEDLDDED
jgi:hypothetical protein